MPDYQQYPQMIDLLREIWPYAGMLLLLTVLRYPVTASQASKILFISRNTARRALQSLVDLQLVKRVTVRQYSGYTYRLTILGEHFLTSILSEIHANHSSTTTTTDKPINHLESMYPAVEENNGVKESYSLSVAQKMRAATESYPETGQNTTGAGISSPHTAQKLPTSTANSPHPGQNLTGVGRMSPELSQKMSPGVTCPPLPGQNMNTGRVRSPAAGQDLSAGSAGEADELDGMQTEERQDASEIRAIRQALRQAGIGEPMASRLARMAHITPEYLQAHLLQAQRDNIPKGLLVHRLRENDLAPELNRYGHLEDCECDDCRRLGYVKYLLEED